MVIEDETHSQKEHLHGTNQGSINEPDLKNVQDPQDLKNPQDVRDNQDPHNPQDNQDKQAWIHQKVANPSQFETLMNRMEVFRTLEHPDNILHRVDLEALIWGLEDLTRLVGMSNPDGPCDQFAELLMLIFLENGNMRGHMMHFLGLGPPGVGKTTFFEKMAVCVNALGLLGNSASRGADGAATVASTTNPQAPGTDNPQRAGHGSDGPKSSAGSNSSNGSTPGHSHPPASTSSTSSSQGSDAQTLHTLACWAVRNQVESSTQRSRETNLLCKALLTDIDHLTEQLRLVEERNQEVQRFLINERWVPYPPLDQRQTLAGWSPGGEQGGGSVRNPEPSGMHPPANLQNEPWHSFCDPHKPCKFEQLRWQMEGISQLRKGMVDRLQNLKAYVQAQRPNSDLLQALMVTEAAGFTEPDGDLAGTQNSHPGPSHTRIHPSFATPASRKRPAPPASSSSGPEPGEKTSGDADAHYHRLQKSMRLHHGKDNVSQDPAQKVQPKGVPPRDPHPSKIPSASQNPSSASNTGMQTGKGIDSAKGKEPDQGSDKKDKATGTEEGKTGQEDQGARQKRMSELRKYASYKPSRAEIHAGYQGQTALKVTELVNSQRGKMLIFDEAQNLINGSQDSYGFEALRVLMKFMSEEPEDLMFSFLGPEDEVCQVLENIKGLSRRLFRIQFPKYGPQDLARIFEYQATRGGGWTFEPQLDLAGFFQEHAQAFPNFGGDTERLLFQCKMAYAAENWSRIVDGPDCEQPRTDGQSALGDQPVWTRDKVLTQHYLNEGFARYKKRAEQTTKENPNAHATDPKTLPDHLVSLYT